jgi:hypothetical protein
MATALQRHKLPQSSQQFSAASLKTFRLQDSNGACTCHSSTAPQQLLQVAEVKRQECRVVIIAGEHLDAACSQPGKTGQQAVSKGQTGGGAAALSWQQQQDEACSTAA